MFELMNLFGQGVAAVVVVLVQFDDFELDQVQQLPALVKHFHFDPLVVY
jgi:hypothetical protein